MTTKTAEQEKRRALAHEPDFYFDELMTAQPEATREFFRARLLPVCDDVRKAAKKV